jgi:hypothetical protein
MQRCCCSLYTRRGADPLLNVVEAIGVPMAALLEGPVDLEP